MQRKPASFPLKRIGNQYKVLTLVLGYLLVISSCNKKIEQPAPTAISQESQISQPATSLPTKTINTGNVPSDLQPPNADVLFVRATQHQNKSWTFDITIQHPDKGWDDYADGWDVVLPDGSIVKPDPDSQFTRLLLHPHVDEQPFTRSQSGVTIPSEVGYVIVRAHDIVSGFGGEEILVDFSKSKTDEYEIKYEGGK